MRTIFSPNFSSSPPRSMCLLGDQESQKCTHLELAVPRRCLHTSTAIETAAAVPPEKCRHTIVDPNYDHRKKGSNKHECTPYQLASTNTHKLAKKERPQTLRYRAEQNRVVVPVSASPFLSAVVECSCGQICGFLHHFFAFIK